MHQKRKPKEKHFVALVKKKNIPVKDEKKKNFRNNSFACLIIESEDENQIELQNENDLVSTMKDFGGPSHSEQIQEILMGDLENFKSLVSDLNNAIFFLIFEYYNSIFI